MVNIVIVKCCYLQDKLKLILLVLIQFHFHSTVYLNYCPTTGGGCCCSCTVCPGIFCCGAGTTDCMGGCPLTTCTDGTFCSLVSCCCAADLARNSAALSCSRWNCCLSYKDKCKNKDQKRHPA